MFTTPLLALHGPRTNNELTAKRVEDSTSMVTIALDNPPIPVIPRAARVSLARRMSRMTIMRVRMILSESEIVKYGRATHGGASTSSVDR